MYEEMVKKHSRWLMVTRKGNDRMGSVEVENRKYATVITTTKSLKKMHEKE